MHFIESLFCVAPDSGSGFLELSLIFIVVAVGISGAWLKARCRTPGTSGSHLSFNK
jgi:hypothetical protein